MMNWPRRRAPRPNVILITDPGPDPDDVKALLVAAMQHARGHICLRAVVCNGGMQAVARARLARCLLDHVGVFDVPVGHGSEGGEYVSQPHEYSIDGYDAVDVRSLFPGCALLVRALRGCRRQTVSLVCISSLRDAAELCLHHTALVLAKVKEVAVQGGLERDPATGAWRPDSSVNNEFDQEAAAAVYGFCLARGLPLSVVSRNAVPLLPMQLARSFADRTLCCVLRYLADAQYNGLEGLWQKLCAGQLPSRCDKQWYFETFCGVSAAEFASSGFAQLNGSQPIKEFLTGYVKPYDVLALMTVLPQTRNLFAAGVPAASEAAPLPACAPPHRLLLRAADSLELAHVLKLLRDTYHDVVLASRNSPDAPADGAGGQQPPPRADDPTEHRSLAARAARRIDGWSQRVGGSGRGVGGHEHSPIKIERASADRALSGRAQWPRAADGAGFGARGSHSDEGGSQHSGTRSGEIDLRRLSNASNSFGGKGGGGGGGERGGARSARAPSEHSGGSTRSGGCLLRQASDGSARSGMSAHGRAHGSAARMTTDCSMRSADWAAGGGGCGGGARGGSQRAGAQAPNPTFVRLAAAEAATCAAAGGSWASSATAGGSSGARSLFGRGALSADAEASGPVASPRPLAPRSVTAELPAGRAAEPTAAAAGAASRAAAAAGAPSEGLGRVGGVPTHASSSPGAAAAAAKALPGAAGGARDSPTDASTRPPPPLACGQAGYFARAREDALDASEPGALHGVLAEAEIASLLQSARVQALAGRRTLERATTTAGLALVVGGLGALLATELVLPVALARRPLSQLAVSPSVRVQAALSCACEVGALVVFIGWTAVHAEGAALRRLGGAGAALAAGAAALSATTAILTAPLSSRFALGFGARAASQLGAAALSARALGAHRARRGGASGDGRLLRALWEALALLLAVAAACRLAELGLLAAGESVLLSGYARADGGEDGAAADANGAAADAADGGGARTFGAVAAAVAADAALCALGVALVAWPPLLARCASALLELGAGRSGRGGAHAPLAALSGFGSADDREPAALVREALRVFAPVRLTGRALRALALEPSDEGGDARYRPDASARAEPSGRAQLRPRDAPPGRPLGAGRTVPIATRTSGSVLGYEPALVEERDEELDDSAERAAQGAPDAAARAGPVGAGAAAIGRGRRQTEASAHNPTPAEEPLRGRPSRLSLLSLRSVLMASSSLPSLPSLRLSRAFPLSAAAVPAERLLRAPVALLQGGEARPAGGAQADYYVVHSWLDSSADGGEAKLGALTDWAAAWARARGRPPAVWLDALCADPLLLPVESLRHMCVYMCRCTRLLLLCGPSLTERLWCVAELYAWRASGGSLQHVDVLLVAQVGAGAAERAQLWAELIAAFDAFHLMWTTSADGDPVTNRIALAVALATVSGVNEIVRAYMPRLQAQAKADADAARERESTASGGSVLRRSVSAARMSAARSSGEPALAATSEGAREPADGADAGLVSVRTSAGAEPPSRP